MSSESAPTPAAEDGAGPVAPTHEQEVQQALYGMERAARDLRQARDSFDQSWRQLRRLDVPSGRVAERVVAVAPVPAAVPGEPEEAAERWKPDDLAWVVGAPGTGAAGKTQLARRKRGDPGWWILDGSGRGLADHVTVSAVRAVPVPVGYVVINPAETADQILELTGPGQTAGVRAFNTGVQAAAHVIRGLAGEKGQADG